MTKLSSSRCARLDRVLSFSWLKKLKLSERQWLKYPVSGEVEVINYTNSNRDNCHQEENVLKHLNHVDDWVWYYFLNPLTKINNILAK